MKSRVSLTIAVLSAVLAACQAPSSSRTADSLTAGERVTLTLRSDASGVTATRIATEEVDCVDGIDSATGAECDGGPAANPTDPNEPEDETEAQANEVEAIAFGSEADIAGPLGITIEAASETGSTRLLGQYLGGHVFHADAAVGTQAVQSRVVTRLQAVRVLADGTVGLTVFDHEIVAKASETVHSVSSAIEELDAAEESDGIDCQQEGEHEGENEGC